MLLHLHVKNLALIREAEIDFSEGLNILTGETGAGKSILIGSMTMALGGKVPREMVREDADYALSELVFTADRPEIRHKLVFRQRMNRLSCPGRSLRVAVSADSMERPSALLCSKMWRPVSSISMDNMSISHY